jgi:hypothetical protein
MTYRSIQRVLVCFVMIAGIILMLSLVLPASAGDNNLPDAQPTPFLTPTPGPDGRITYIVQDGDTLWRIAAIAGISIDELMTRNGIQPGDFITEGMPLELGLGVPAQPSAVPGVEPTDTPQAPTPTPVTVTGEICVLLFQDDNGNARLDEGEAALPDGQVSVADVSGVLAGEHATDLDPEGYCFEGLSQGDYNVSAAVPPEHNPTTSMNVPLRLAAGDINYVQFGAQPGLAIVGGEGSGTSNRSTTLGVLGFVLLIGGGVLGFFAYRYRRQIR